MRKLCAALIPPAEATTACSCLERPPCVGFPPSPRGLHTELSFHAGLYDRGCDNWVTICDANFTLETEEGSCSYLKKDRVFLNEN